MYNATIKSKERNAQDNLVVTVEFSNGTRSVTETVVPQDKAGFLHWVNSRLASLNTADELEAEDNLDQEVDVTPAVVTPTAKELWYQDLGKLQFAKNLVDLGVLTGNETAYTNLQNKVKTDFDVTYLQ